MHGDTALVRSADQASRRRQRAAGRWNDRIAFCGQPWGCERGRSCSLGGRRARRRRNPQRQLYAPAFCQSRRTGGERSRRSSRRAPIVNAATTTGGATALHLPPPTVTSASVAALLDAHAAVDARDSAYRQTPLMWAAAANRARAINLLVARGADLKRRPASKTSPKGSADSPATQKKRCGQSSLAGLPAWHGREVAVGLAAAAVPVEVVAGRHDLLHGRQYRGRPIRRRQESRSTAAKAGREGRSCGADGLPVFGFGGRAERRRRGTNRKQQRLVRQQGRADSAAVRRARRNAEAVAAS